MEMEPTETPFSTTLQQPNLLRRLLQIYTWLFHCLLGSLNAHSNAKPIARLWIRCILFLSVIRTFHPEGYSKWCTTYATFWDASERRTGSRKVLKSSRKQLQDWVVAYRRGKKLPSQYCASVQHLPSMGQDKAFMWSVGRNRGSQSTIALSTEYRSRHVGIQGGVFQCPCRWLLPFNQWAQT